MRALILSGGHGEQMLPLSRNIPKTMLSLHGKPIVHHVLDSLHQIGINKFAVVVGYLSNEIVEYFSQLHLDVDIKLIHQGSAEGVLGAIISAKKEFENDEQFLLAYGDIIAPVKFYQHTLQSWKDTKVDGVIAVTLKGEVSDYGVATISENCLVSEIREHPKITEKHLGNYVVAGSYILPKSFWAYLEKFQSSENPLEDALNNMIADKIKLGASIWDENWCDVAVPWDLLSANKLLFENTNYSFIHYTADISPTAIIQGPVIIDKYAKVDNNAVIKGPVYIGPRAFIGTNCLIREYSMISEGCKIGYSCEIKNSIIQPYTKIGRLSFIGDSILGRKIEVMQTTTMNEVGGGEFHGRKTIEIRGSIYNKLGCVIGDGTIIGANTVINPGAIIDSNQLIPPGSVVESVLDHEKTRNSKLDH